jgi:hypothetical protein
LLESIDVCGCCRGAVDPGQEVACDPGPGDQYPAAIRGDREWIGKTAALRIPGACLQEASPCGAILHFEIGAGTQRRVQLRGIEVPGKQQGEGRVALSICVDGCEDVLDVPTRADPRPVKLTKDWVGVGTWRETLPHRLSVQTPFQPDEGLDVEARESQEPWSRERALRRGDVGRHLAHRVAALVGGPAAHRRKQKPRRHGTRE